MKSRTLKLPLILLIAAVAGVPAPRAQGPRGPGGMPPGGLELRRELFAPELVMRHQEEIGLSEEQKATLVREMQKLQSDLVPLQFEMSDAAGKLTAALSPPRVDEAKAAELADRLMSLESQIKKRHLALMIRIKNTLTPEQQDRLRALRQEPEGRGGAGGRRPRAPGGPGGRSDGPMR
jgi:Spy/CpxP family protein refolding chaperone